MLSYLLPAIFFRFRLSQAALNLIFEDAGVPKTTTLVKASSNRTKRYAGKRKLGQLGSPR